MSKGAENGMIAIVTGAGSGIGRAIARRLAADGAAVTVNDFAEKKAKAVAAEIVKAGGRALSVGGDVADEEAVKAMVAAGAAKFGSATVLVNCAGHVHQAAFLEIEPADFDRMIAVHVRGTYLCSRAVLPAMLARRAGAIVNVASQLGQIGGIELAHYSAAKAAIIGMTKSLAREVSAQGVRVNAVAPGPVWTPLNPADRQADQVARFGAQTAMKRPAQPEEIAPAFVFLASPQMSSYITGEILPVIGGY